LDAVVVQCGIGKVNAAMCAQIMCSVFGVTHLVNTGVAGSLCNELDIGDILVSVDAMHHDFDCSPVGYVPGKIPGLDVLAFPADEKLSVLAFEAAEQVNPGLTVHDFRMVAGPTHTNLVFDALVAVDDSRTDSELRQCIREVVRGMDEHYFAVVTIDHPYT
jgi:5'-methylthioadenosine/S-adenosylhomocysteine nucleosidase